MERCFAGIGAVVFRVGLLGTGRGALLVSSAVPKEQQSSKALLCCGRGVCGFGREEDCSVLL